MKKVLPLSLLLAVSLYNGCKKEATIPVLSTTTIYNITATTAISGGNITSDGRAVITSRGICWGITANPTTSDTKTFESGRTGQFMSNITGILAGRTYHVRAYATNSVGTAYGADLQFSTLGQVPTASTLAASNITLTGSTLNGTVSANYSSTTVTFLYGLTSYDSTVTATQSPVIGNMSTNVSAGITGLAVGTTYHFRVKAVNSLGTVYGDDMIFTTVDTIPDVDGNVYNTVTIGTQVWMKENLNTTKYNDGTAIPYVADRETWVSLSTGAYCDYDNTPANSTTYGRLYNWYVGSSTNPKKVCPTGWHVPSNAEWRTLTNYLGGERVAGGKLKEIGNTHWINPNTATNETGFTALPGGFRDIGGSFYNIGDTGLWWSSTERDAETAWYRFMYCNLTDVSSTYHLKSLGYSVRCLRDF